MRQHALDLNQDSSRARSCERIVVEVVPLALGFAILSRGLRPVGVGDWGFATEVCDVEFRALALSEFSAGRERC